MDKIDSVFDKLLEYAKKHLKSVVHNGIFLEIKVLLKDVMKDNGKILHFQQIGFELANADVIFNEALSIFEFIRKSFNRRKFEYLIEEIENHVALGYLKYEASLLRDKLDFIERNIVSKDVHKLLADPLKIHIGYFRNLLETVLKDDASTNTVLHQPCPFGAWLNEKAKEYIDDEFILRDIKRMHQHFHNLIDVAEDYKRSGRFKDLYFTILNLENTTV
jgi:hypothetical protein